MKKRTIKYGLLAAFFFGSSLSPNIYSVEMEEKVEFNFR